MGVGVRGCVARIRRLCSNVVTVKGCCPKAMNVHSLLVGFKEHRKWFRANRFNKFCDKSAAWNCFIFYQTNESSRYMQIESNESQSGYTEDLEVLCQRIVTPFTLDTKIMDLVSRKTPVNVYVNSVIKRAHIRFPGCLRRGIRVSLSRRVS